jgi:uncharacterized protein YggU (UPF0235/DUF167 family)
MIRVYPGARRTEVGGARGAALVVRVLPRAVDGKATEAALSAVADAFGIPRADVRLVSGARGRDKLLRIDGERDELDRRLSALRGQP